MNRAGAAERHAAAEFGAGHAEHVAQDPEQRGVAVDINRPIDAVDLDRDCHGYPQGGTTLDGGRCYKAVA